MSAQRPGFLPEDPYADMPEPLRGRMREHGEHGPGTARCEHTIGHDGPVKPRWRHVGPDDAGDWQVWESQP